MNDHPASATFRAENEKCDPTVVTLRLPDVEEIARAIWQRQHDALNAEAITSDLKWRDHSVPRKFWDEFLMDAQVVLAMLQRGHVEHPACEKASRDFCKLGQGKH